MKHYLAEYSVGIEITFYLGTPCVLRTSFLSSTYLLQGSFFAEIATGFVKDLKSISFGVRHLCEHKKPQKNTLSCVSNVCIFMLKKNG